jgi:hypothetical protein
MASFCRGVIYRVKATVEIGQPAEKGYEVRNIAFLVFTPGESVTGASEEAREMIPEICKISASRISRTQLTEVIPNPTMDGEGVYISVKVAEWVVANHGSLSKQ